MDCDHGEFVLRAQAEVVDMILAEGRATGESPSWGKYSAKVKVLGEQPGKSVPWVHVLGERDGWLYVIVPRNELTWQTDWNGTYGFVLAQDMAVGISKADATYRN